MEKEIILQGGCMKTCDFPDSPSSARLMMRNGVWQGITTGLVAGYAQANLVILPKKFAYDFLLFAQRNPKPCPLLEVTDVGNPYLKMIASNADARTDLPLYRIYRNGKLESEVLNITEYWQNDFVAFFLGCSFSFEWALIEAGVPMRHIEASRNVSMYTTNIQTNSAGVFKGPLVVSMRPIPYDMVTKAVNITSRFPRVHGAPIHIGYPEQIGITDIQHPEFGDPPVIKKNDVPVFWACGVTPQAVAITSNIEFIITHAPGYMFITDIKNVDLAIF